MTFSVLMQMYIRMQYTRRSNALHLPAVRTILRKRSILFTGPLIWYQLNPDLHILPSVASFKLNYKKFLNVCILNLYQ